MPSLVAVAVGAVLALLGMLLLVPLPEVGLPMLLGGLRLLGRRYSWARSMNRRVDRVAEGLASRFRRLPRPARWSVVGAFALVGLLLVAVTLQHLS